MHIVSAEGFRALLETVPDGFFVHDESGRILDLSDRCSADLGYAREDLLEMSILDISGGIAGPESPLLWREASAGFTASYCDVAVHRDGTRLPVEVRLICQIVDGRKLFLGVAIDVAENGAERPIDARFDAGIGALRIAHERLAMAAAGGGLGIWDYDIERDEMQCDPQWYRIMGRDPAERIRSVADFRAIIHADDVERATEVHQAAERLAPDANYGIIFRIIWPDGMLRWVRSAASIVRDGEGAPIRAVGFVVDITDMQDATASLEQKSREDPLTGLANRRHFDKQLQRACLHAKRTGEPLTLAMIDVDHFKLFNDREGHLRGDEALKAVAGVLSATTRCPYDLAARYGGDEFLLLLPGTGDPAELLDQIASDLAALELASAPTVSCGCVVASELADVEPYALFAECDRALYRAKQAGRNRIEIVRI